VSHVVQCPFCGTKFNVPSDVAGKPIQCMNLECRKVFSVKSVSRPVEPAAAPPPAPPAPPKSQPVPRPPSSREPGTSKQPGSSREPSPPRPKRPVSPGKHEVVEGQVVEAALVRPPQVKEVVWSEDLQTPPPPARGKKPPRAEAVEPPEGLESDDVPIVRRKKKPRNRAAWLLIAMGVGVVVLVGFGALYLLRQQDLAEEQLRQQADADYKKGDYPAAKRTFDRLVTEYPNSEEAPRYRFFADLCGMQVVVRGVTNRENPGPAVERLKKFVADQRGSPFAKPTSGFGRDVLEAGKKLAEDVVAHAGDRLKKYQDARKDPAVAEELNKAQDAVTTGRELIAILEPFRAPDDPPLDALQRSLEEVDKSIRRERERTAALTSAAARLTTVSDSTIQLVEGDLAAAGFLDDPEAQELLAAAKGRLRELVKFEAEDVPPRAAPASPAWSLLYVAPVGQTRRPVGDDSGPPAVFLAIARGILYALDEDSGMLLWAVRVGADVTDPPAVARVSLEGGTAELAVVTLHAGGEPALAGYVLRTGEPRWYQPLPAPAAGPAVVIGTRGYVALRDEAGTVYEFDLTTGVRKGRIRIGQPIGPPPVARAGTGQIYVAASHTRIFVIDAGAKDEDGVPQPPQCVQVIATNHPTGTLRTPPVFLGPEGDTPADRWMVLAQADGPTATKIAPFTLTPPPPPSPDGRLPPEIPAKAAAAPLRVPDWVWFPPVSDGERLALVTDSGQFRVFGINQPGNLDQPLFRLPEPKLPTPPGDQRVRGLVFPAEEASFWVLANGTLRKYRVGLVPTRGIDLLATGAPLLVGEPTQPAQLNHRRDAACLVLRSLNSAGYTALLMNLHTGEIRWQRQLGLIPASVPVVQDGSIVSASEDGGIVSLPSAAVRTGQTTVAPPEWIIAASPENVAGPTHVAASPDGKTLFTVTPLSVTDDSKPVAKWLIRRVVAGRLLHEGSVVAPGDLAGLPVVLGDSLIVPASDGFLHRYVPGTGRANPDRLMAGPPWKTGGRTTQAVCSVIPVTDSTFFTSDGGKKLVAWSWPKEDRWSATANPIELRERPAGAALVLPPVAPTEPTRLLIADVSGSVWLYAADRAGPPLRRWKPGVGLPAGRPSSPFVPQQVAGQRPTVAYTVDDRYAVCIDPDQDAPKWSVLLADDVESTLVGPPQPLGDGRWVTTDLGGRLTVIDASGTRAGTVTLGLPGAVPAVAATSIGGDQAILALSDGSTVVATLPSPPAAAPEPKAKE